MKHFWKQVDGWFNFPQLFHSVVQNARSGANFVEIGSWKGQSTTCLAVEIANSRKKINFWAVDHWSYDHHRSLGNDNLYREFLLNTTLVSEQIKPLRMSSVDAARLFPNDYFDFVYIDAAHAYASVVADLDAWLPKTARGGIICGDDYSKQYFPGVVRAVNERFANDFTVHQENGWTAWLHCRAGRRRPEG